MKSAWLVLAIVWSVVLVGFIGLQVVQCELFSIRCGGYLERASNANTVEIAEAQLTTALAYLVKHEMTEGYTSVVYRSPGEDVGYWFNNLKASCQELRSLRPSASGLEKSNMLIKLRETILSQGEHGGYVTVPPGIAQFPNNAFYCWVSVLLMFLTAVAWVLWMATDSY